MAGEGTFLAALGVTAAGELQAEATPRSYSPGDALLRVGDPPDRVILLTAGRVKIVSQARGGREALLAIRGPGDVLGEMSAFDGAPRSATALAIDAVQALELGPRAFRDFMAARPEATLSVLSLLSRRLRDADAKRLQFAALDSVGRLCSCLVELAERFGREDAGTVTIDLPLSQEELATWTASSKEAVTKALQQLRRLGWIETARLKITVCDLSALRERASL
jgi:CRP-like cAMP-binding protein